MRQTKHEAFTLIELLVVITIIVVLLALLVPALDKAIYQAELTACASQIRHLSGAVTTYAFGARRYYPDRGTSEWYDNDHHGLLRWHPIVTQRTVDHREVVKSVLADINRSFNDPLTEAVDFERTDAHWIWSPYCLWYGFRYGPNGSMMTKIGQRWNCMWDGVNQRFDVLISDFDQVSPNLRETQASHPDNKYGSGLMHNEVIQDRYSPWPLAAGTMTRTLWWTGEGVVNWQRDPLDDNFGMADLSVQRIDRIESDPPDDRLRRVRAFSGGGQLRWNYVP